jgi:hypothetical protein
MKHTMVPIPADPRWILEDEKQRIHADDLFNWYAPVKRFSVSPP